MISILWVKIMSILSRELERFIVTLKDLALRSGFDEMLIFEKLNNPWLNNEYKK